ncbi:hypothetical protein SJAG_00160 [Schizosaccharomyces japonicus yFS275]|uniref:Clr5 domain-containing protein n=1 Tax=Schizosaccharomyces japonicus (strain yFS275 / FY16936) TaxID=402676 RepID=B6JXM0_SCHJY|nr:hypothetical protein SJAG_00160 [Schizosaccharomyces japonicus yFS275]EEB05164.2 hypothetical protein SJAG_00160 [Schizosaccharomyces japonicus yFS275]
MTKKWEERREHIMEIASVTGMTLRELQERMFKYYNFKASLRSYKRILSRWGIQLHRQRFIFPTAGAVKKTGSGNISAALDEFVTKLYLDYHTDKESLAQIQAVFGLKLSKRALHYRRKRLCLKRPRLPTDVAKSRAQAAESQYNVYYESKGSVNGIPNKTQSETLSAESEEDSESGSAATRDSFDASSHKSLSPPSLTSKEQTSYYMDGSIESAPHPVMSSVNGYDQIASQSLYMQAPTVNPHMNLPQSGMYIPKHTLVAHETNVVLQPTNGDGHAIVEYPSYVELESSQSSASTIPPDVAHYEQTVQLEGVPHYQTGNMVGYAHVGVHDQQHPEEGPEMSHQQYSSHENSAPLSLPSDVTYNTGKSMAHMLHDDPHTVNAAMNYVSANHLLNLHVPEGSTGISHYDATVSCPMPYPETSTNDASLHQLDPKVYYYHALPGQEHDQHNLHPSCSSYANGAPVIMQASLSLGGVNHVYADEHGCAQGMNHVQDYDHATAGGMHEHLVLHKEHAYEQYPTNMNLSLQQVDHALSMDANHDLHQQATTMDSVPDTTINDLPLKKHFVPEAYSTLPVSIYSDQTIFLHSDPATQSHFESSNTRFPFLSHAHDTGFSKPELFHEHPLSHHPLPPETLRSI